MEPTATPSTGHFDRIGVRVECALCRRMKAPLGRRAPVSMNACEPFECSGYQREPHVGSLWPGETASSFGYPEGD